MIGFQLYFWAQVGSDDGGAFAADCSKERRGGREGGEVSLYVTTWKVLLGFCLFVQKVIPGRYFINSKHSSISPFLLLFFFPLLSFPFFLAKRRKSGTFPFFPTHTHTYRTLIHPSHPFCSKTLLAKKNPPPPSSQPNKKFFFKREPYCTHTLLP